MTLHSKMKRLLKIVAIIAAIAAFIWAFLFWASIDGDRLQMAVMHGNARRVSIYLTLRPDLAKYKTFHNYTPLHWAAMDGRVDIAKALIAKGADVNAVSEEKVTPLFLAAQRGHTAVVRLLLKHGADANIKADCSNDTYGKRHYGNLKLELSPLHAACDNGHSAIVNALLTAGAEVNDLDNEKNTPLHYAVTSGDVASVRILLDHGADPNAKGQWGYVPLDSAGTPEVVKALCDHGARTDSGRLAGILKTAAHCGDVTLANYLLAQGVDPNADDPSGSTALCETTSTCDCGEAPGRLRVARLLIEHGANVNKPGKYGLTPLRLAGFGGVTTLAKLLMEHGARDNDFFVAIGCADTKRVSQLVRSDPALVNARLKAEDWKGCMPLHIAVASGSAHMVKLLLELGCDPEVTPKDRISPLQAAAEGSDLKVFSLLFSSATNPDLTDLLVRAAGSGKLDTVKFLLAKGAQVNGIYGDPSSYQSTALRAAVDMEHEATVKYLLSVGAKLDLLEEHYGSILNVAFSSLGSDGSETAEILLAHGADVNAKPAFGGSLLYDYASNPVPGAVRFLLKHGANPNARTEFGSTPLDKAQDPETIRLLLQYGGKPSLQGNHQPLLAKIKGFFTRTLRHLPWP